MTQITGDDYPTYEDSVNESLKEIAEKTMNKYSNTLPRNCKATSLKANVGP